ncbi:MAG: serine hydrolase, partial [Actinobacteria bacterium]|nr:serine hydrolase [Actinomycetota bacterium]
MSERDDMAAAPMGRRRRSRVSMVLAVAAVAVGLVSSACSSTVLVASAAGYGSSGSADSAHLRQRRCDEPAAGADQALVDPSELGLDPAAVRAAITYAVAKGSQSVRVYRHGCLVGVGTDDPQLEAAPLPGWSMTKGVVSMLVGRAVTLGRLSVDDPIGRYLSVEDPRKAAITVRQLLNQTSGLRMAWVDDLLDSAGDSVAKLLARPFETVPGTTFDYAQTTVTTLGAVVQAAVGEDLQDFAQRELFGPIGIERGEWEWFRDGAGHSQGFAFLQMTSEAWGRLGRLLEQDGMWAGRRLLGATYIAQGRAGTAANSCYGFLWRNNDGVRCGQTGPLLGVESDTNWMPTVPTDAYGLSGMFDQLVLVIPSLDMVVVRVGLPHQLFPDPVGDVDGQQPAMTWRFFRML